MTWFSDLQKYLNYQNKRYEPTFFLNEEYIPPREDFPQTVDLWYKRTNSPVPKDFIFPIPKQFSGQKNSVSH